MRCNPAHFLLGSRPTAFAAVRYSNTASDCPSQSTDLQPLRVLLGVTGNLLKGLRQIGVARPAKIICCRGGVHYEPRNVILPLAIVTIRPMTSEARIAPRCQLSQRHRIRQP